MSGQNFRKATAFPALVVWRKVSASLLRFNLDLPQVAMTDCVPGLIGSTFGKLGCDKVSTLGKACLTNPARTFPERPAAGTTISCPNHRLSDPCPHE